MTDSTGSGITWTADISNGPALVTDVVIDATKEEGYGYRLSLVNVFIDDVFCGQTPENTQDNVSYTVTCDTPLSGSQIKLETTKDDHYLAFTGICANAYEELRVGLEYQISILEASESSLIQQVSDCDDEVSRLTGLLDAEYADNDALRAERDDLLQQIASLNLQITTLQSEKSELQVQIDGYISDKADLQSQVDTLTESEASLTIQVANLEASESSLLIQVSDLE